MRQEQGPLSDGFSRDSPTVTRLTSVFQPRLGHDLLPGGPEFVHYVTIKLHVYRKALENAKKQTTYERHQEPEVITARRLRKLAQGLRGRPTIGSLSFPDFVGATPQTFREGLRNLNHGSFLNERGRGLRRAVMYEWREPILYSNVCSFLALHRLVGGHTSLGLDLYRIREAFHRHTFTTAELQELALFYREMQPAQRWFGIRGSSNSGALLRFMACVSRRLLLMRQLGLLVIEGNDWTATNRGLEAAHWFDLFAHSVSYRQTVGQCSQCPLRTACWEDRLGPSLGIPTSIPRRDWVLGRVGG